MSETPFHNTQYGRRFFDHQLPALIGALDRIGAELEKQNEPELMVEEAPTLEEKIAILVVQLEDDGSDLDADCWQSVIEYLKLAIDADPRRLMREQSAVYVIRSKTEKVHETGEHLYWSNDGGWVGRQEATMFSPRERTAFNLPAGGEWEQV